MAMEQMNGLIKTVIELNLRMMNQQKFQRMNKLLYFYLIIVILIIILHFSHFENSLPEIKSLIVNAPSSEKEISKKSTTTARSSSIFKVKFKKDDFLTKKTQGKT